MRGGLPAHEGGCCGGDDRSKHREPKAPGGVPTWVAMWTIDQARKPREGGGGWAGEPTRAGRASKLGNCPATPPRQKQPRFYC
ncbi:hypothetical protein [Vulcanisaeta distributa]|uniref:hypothetical protein n=1 Tax=Vulcanisaeta distributa TaxID=164451 RepID=UPI001FB21E9F|nr:hypothetical protein [Vulcanisaeta distributa]